MGYIAKLEHGPRTLDIASGRYRVGDDFVPPTILRTVYTAPGSSANTMGGASRYGERAENSEWSFSVHLVGTSIAKLKRAADELQRFLDLASDDSYPLYLRFNPSDATPDPIWGQNGTVRYEIVAARVTLPADAYYSQASVSAQGVPFCTVTLTTKPFPIGMPQVVAQAKGSVQYDTPGAMLGMNKGVIVCNPTTNYFTNPVFGHPTWNTGWSEGANLDAYENSDPRYILWGVRSAKLQATGATRLWYQALTLSAVTFTLSFYAKRPDGDPVTSADCVAYFANVLQTPTYTAVGDGWYRVVYTGTASAAAANYGVGLGANALVYVDGFQVENLGYATALCHGDMYGSAWSSTAHASTTTRTTPYLRVPLASDVYNIGQGAIRAVVTVPNVPTTNFVVWQEAATSMRLYYDQAASQWTFSDGTNAIAYTQGITAGATYVLHATWENGRLQLYINGASVASGATFTAPSAAPTYLYIGTTATPAFQQTQTFGGLLIFGEALTTAQVLADYNNISPIVADGQCVDPIPYFWVKDGDSILDTFDDSTRDNWGVIAGVPGSAPADTEYCLYGATIIDAYDAVFSLWQTQEFIPPTRVLYQDYGGTADANCSGGSYYRIASMGTSESAMNTNSALWTTDRKAYRFVEGRQFYCVGRVRSNPLRAMFQRLSLGTGRNIDGKTTVPVGSIAFKEYILDAITFPVLDTKRLAYNGLAHYMMMSAYSVGGTVVDTDYYCLMPRPFAKLKVGTTNTVIRGGTYVAEDSGVAAIADGLYSDSLDVLPNTYNVLLVAMLTPIAYPTDAPLYTFNFTSITLTPRYAIG